MALKRSLFVLAALLGCLGLAACGSSSNSSSSSSTTGGGSTQSTEAEPEGGSQGLQAAEAAVTAALKTPSPIGRSPLAKPAPKGIHIAYVSCPLETCTAVEQGVKEATKVLGWTVTSIQGGIDPQSQNKGWTSAVESHPDAIVGITTAPFSAIAEPLAKAEEENIPIATIAGNEGPNGAIISSLISPASLEPVGKVMADWVASESKGKGNVALFNDPSNESFNAATKAFETELPKACPECQAQTVRYTTLDIGKALPGQVVSFLQSNPDVEYLGFTLGSATLGVPQALESAGLGEKVKIFSRAATPANQVDIAQGSEAMGVAEGLTSLAWEALDALARKLNGETIPSSIGEPESKFQMLTAENINEAVKPDPSAIWQLEGVPQQFTKIWHR